MIRDLRDLRKLSLLFSLTLLVSGSDLEDILSQNRIELIDAQKKKVKIEAKELERSWINPIRVEYSKHYSTQINRDNTPPQDSFRR